MGQVVVEMGRAEFNGVGVIAGKNNQVEELNSGVGSSHTSITANKNDFATVINNSASDVWIIFGPAVSATVGQGHFVPSGKMRDFGGLAAGDRAAVINDS